MLADLWADQSWTDSQNGIVYVMKRVVYIVKKHNVYE